jgi:hypothetical protein
MALPKIDVPVYDLTLPLSKKHIRYRPFLVKEQRNLLMALEADDTKTIEQNIRQVLINCTIGDIDVDSLPVTDVEYYFIQLRARSVGEVVQNKYKCNNEVDDKECGNIMDVNINLLDIKVDVDPDVKDEIQVTDKIVIKLHYPQFSIMKRFTEEQTSADIVFNMIAESIDYIFDGDQYYYAKESTPEELVEFIESLSQEQFGKLEEFFNNLPKLNKQVKMKCSKCGFDHSIDVEGLESFFG